MKSSTLRLLIFSVLILGSSSVLITTNPAFATTLTLSPTSGNIGSQVNTTGTLYSFTGSQTFTDSQASDNVIGLPSQIRLQKLSGLIANDQISKVGFNFQATGIGDFSSSQGDSSSNTAGLNNNNIRLQEYTGLDAGGTITKVQMNVIATGGSIRIKIYSDDGIGGIAKTLLGESENAVNAVGVQNFPVSATIPADHNVWVGWEVNDPNVNFGFHLFGANQATLGAVSHTYGAGPSSITPSGNNQQFQQSLIWHFSSAHIRVKIYDHDGIAGIAKTLLGQSTSQTISGITTGIRNFTVSAKIPSDGSVWVGFEVDNPETNILFHLFGVNQATLGAVSHTYGAGPNPITPNGNNQEFYEQVTYGTNIVSFTWDGSPLTTIPTPLTTDTNGKFTNYNFTVPSSSNGPHTVNASDTSGKFATATFTVTGSINVSFQMWLNDLSAMITTGSVIQTINGISTTSNINATGWASFGTGIGQQANYTFIDASNTFVVYKLINQVYNLNTSTKIPTWEMTKNCVGGGVGFQSDFVIQTNDTDGTHITNIPPVTCTNQNQLSYSVTFTDNGNNPAIFNSLTRIKVGNSAYAGNPTSFTVNGATVPTTFTGGQNILSNPYTVGTGLVNTTLNYIINLAQVQPSSSAGTTGGGTMPTCTTNPFDPSCGPTTPPCQYGTNPSGVCIVPNSAQCPYGQNPDGTCVNATPQCQYGTTPTGTCIVPTPFCPYGTNPDGTCFTPTPQQCPYGTTSTGTCASPPIPPNNPLNPTNPNNPLSQIIADQALNNAINGLLGGGQGAKITVQGITYTPTSDILSIGQIKDESIGVAWQSPSNLYILQLSLANVTQFGITLNPTPPYNLTGSYTGSSSGLIKYTIAVPPNYCSNTITANCLDPNSQSFIIPVNIAVILDGKEVRNTINLQFTVLKQQTIATITIFAIVALMLLGILLGMYFNRKKKKKEKKTKKVNHNKYLK